MKCSMVPAIISLCFSVFKMFMCLGVLLVLCLCTMSIQCLWRTEESVRSSRTTVTDVINDHGGVENHFSLADCQEPPQNSSGKRKQPEGNSSTCLSLNAEHSSCYVTSALGTQAEEAAAGESIVSSSPTYHNSRPSSRR